MADKVLAPETRTVTAPIELREAAGAAPLLVGYASTFSQQYDMGTFSERVDPAAFDKTLGTSPDVRLLIDHEGQPLARTKSGTLKLSTDDIGLRVEATLDPSDPDVQRLMPKMRRGDLDQMSFAFRVPSGGDDWTPDYSVRTLREINLQGGDVSVVTYPANPTTSVAMRSLDVLTAKTVFVETIMREARAGKAITADSMSKLALILVSLAAVDEALDEADAGLDGALQAVSALMGVPNPDPAEPGEAQANSLPLNLSTRISTALSL